MPTTILTWLFATLPLAFSHSGAEELPAHARTAPADAAQIQRQILAYRNLLQRGHLIYHQTYYVKGERAPRYDRTTEIWFDGKKIRNDIWLRYEADGPVIRIVHAFNCEKDGHAFDFPGMHLVTDQHVALNLHKITRYPRGENPAYVTDPRVFGLVPDNIPNLARYTLNTWVGKSDQRDVAQKRVKWNAMDASEISYSTSKGTAVRMWIVPEYGPSIRRLELRAAGPEGAPYVWTLECDYDNKLALWYPSQCTYNHLINGKPEEREVTKVDVVSLNQPVDPNTLTLAGMDLPADTAISTEEGLMVWTGSALARYDALPRNAYRSGPGVRRWLLFSSAVVCAVLAAFLLYRFYHQSARKRPGTQTIEQ